MILHFLTLDILLGVMGGGMFASAALGVDLPAAWWFVVPGATWCVYTLDRIVDARRMKGDYPTLRHAFHQRHATLLLTLVVVVAACSGVIGLLMLPPSSILIALVVVSLFLLHHAFQRVIRTHCIGAFKDMNVVLAYCISIWAIPLLQVQHITVIAGAAIAAHVTMVLGTVVVESMPDRDIDRGLDQPNVALILGVRLVRWLLSALILALLACAWMLRSTTLWPVAAAWAACLVVLPRLFRSTLPLPYKRMAVELTLALPLVMTGPWSFMR